MTTGNYPDTSSSTNTATAYNDDDDDDDDKPERGLSHVPQRYVLNPLHRSVSDPQAADVPVVDLADLGKEMEEGMQVIILNCYPPCPDPRLALGLPPHSDYSCFTILLQSSQGLEIKDFLDGEWKVVPHKVDGSLQVHIGDHLEVLSNGIYRSLIHRATLNSEKNRISIASLHSMGLEKKMVTAAELVDEQHPRGYRESSFKDFLNFLATVDGSEGKSFLDSLKITN